MAITDNGYCNNYVAKDSNAFIVTANYHLVSYQEVLIVVSLRIIGYTHCQLSYQLSVVVGNNCQLSSTILSKSLNHWLISMNMA